MHLPERALRGGRLGGLGGVRARAGGPRRAGSGGRRSAAGRPSRCSTRARMPLRGGAVRALEVAVHDQLEVGAVAAAHVVVGPPAPSGPIVGLGRRRGRPRVPVRAAASRRRGSCGSRTSIRVPYPIVLVLGGLAIGFVPGLPDVELAPDVVFLVFLPPLLVAAGYYASPQELRAERAAARRTCRSASCWRRWARSPSSRTRWSTGCRGRAPSCSARSSRRPTRSPRSRPSAARTSPERVRLVVEGEAMINDATALVAFRVARRRRHRRDLRRRRRRAGLRRSGRGRRHRRRPRRRLAGRAARSRGSPTGRWRSC